MQSLLGRKILEKQLVRLGVLKAGETVKSHEAFNTAYKIGEPLDPRAEQQRGSASHRCASTVPLQRYGLSVRSDSLPLARLCLCSCSLGQPWR